MSTEGQHPRHYQIKSRVQHLCSFPVGLASKHVLDAWENHLRRPDDGGDLVVVLERGVGGEEALNNFDQPLDQALPQESAFREKLCLEGQERGMNVAAIADLLSSTTVVGVTWEEVTCATADQIAALETVSLPPSTQRIVVERLRHMIAEASVANADVDYEHRSGLSRGEIVASIESVAEQIDVNSLEFALADGICESFDLSSQATGDDRFYEGVSTQPGHVAAGLVVAQPETMDRVLFGLDDLSAVVITGPSGVGKSAVLWTVPSARRDVVWYRVRRLTREDVPHLVRLARAYDASPDAPVGFLVDAAGTDRFSGWDQLRSEAAAIPGVLLVATARVEDLLILGDLSGCATVTVRLDDVAAETIFEGLKRREATTAAHWREAFNESGGLTLEFTHLLTRGARLAKVIGEQIRRRFVDGRHEELEVLRLVSVADRWSASLPTSETMTTCGMTEWELREVIERLAEEHLIVERDGAMSGLHQLRSTSISDIIHDQPPPSLDSTIRKVIGLVPDHQLSRFVANLLRDVPTAVATVINAAADESPKVGRLSAYMEGLRLFDFYEVAKTWQDIVDEHQIPASCRPLAFFYAAVGLQMGDFMPAELRTAQDAMQAVQAPSTRNDLLSQIGEGIVAELVVSEESIRLATQMLAVLQNSTPSLIVALKEALSDNCPLVRTLQCAHVDDLAGCLAAAHLCDVTLAESLLDLIGGTSHILARLRTDNPWITELDIRTDGTSTLAYARILHVSDAVQSDAQGYCDALGPRLIRCLPQIDSVDIKAFAPGGHEMRIGDYSHGVSQLKREHDYPESRLDWNVARSREAYALLGDTDTNRLSAALPLIREAALLVQEMATGLLIGRPIRVSRQEFPARVLDLHRKGRELKPPLAPTGVNDTGTPQKQSALIVDNLSSLIVDITGNMFKRLADPEQHHPLAAYISGTVLKHLEGATREPWSLLGIDGHPQSLDRLRCTLIDLYIILKQSAGGNRDRIFRSARSGRPKEALHRAARTSRNLENQRINKKRRAVQQTCDTTGLNTEVLTREQDRPILLEFAITVELDSLLDWFDHADRLREALRANRPVDETYLLVPLREGRPVPRLVLALNTSLLPSPGLGDWAAILPDPWPSQLADIFDKANNALQFLSGISHLPEDKLGHQEVQAAAEDAVEQLHGAHQGFLDITSDPLVVDLIELIEVIATQVQTELDGTHTDSTFMEQLVTSLYQEIPTSSFNVILSYTLLALEWDIDPEKAISLLSSNQ
jgi:hypothetical protein